MKHYIFFLGVLMYCSCNNAGKDPVEKADSVNNAQYNAAKDSTIPPVDKASATFLVDAANSIMTGQQLGELAFQKALNPQLRSFGSKIMKDHGTITDQIKTLGSILRVSIPADVSEANMKMLDGLKGKDNQQFDKALVKAILKEHEDAVALFKTADGKVDNADVKNLIVNASPQLSLHLDSAKLIDKMIH